ncbi:CAP domain-containing protein [Galbibacter mesophilus]|uniref:CAP domain-containing protein n=1 Tax=Galbibacter mesophilus TaxID=379069 RepID=UPI00191CB4AC|nr:CAP domain-containing protein [Galbibacter mesophilus]MCM5662432.1 CAP domain-containing protein [Galbibacter mesophilus]
MRKFRIMISFLFAIAFLLSCSNEELQEESFIDEAQLRNTVKSIEQEVYLLVNDYRIQEKLTPLEYSNLAYPFAEEQTRYMISSGHMKHNNFNERATSLANVTDAVSVAENIAMNYPTGKEAVAGWISSAGHLKNIKGDFTHTAISVAGDKNGVLYFTQLFYRAPSE